VIRSEQQQFRKRQARSVFLIPLQRLAIPTPPASKLLPLCHLSISHKSLILMTRLYPFSPLSILLEKESWIEKTSTRTSAEMLRVRAHQPIKKELEAETNS
jgi:hypothetical protein